MTAGNAEENLVKIALSTLQFELLHDQRELLEELAEFALTGPANGVFVVNGYAGTGKTTVVGAFIRAMTEMKRKTVVVAPTGRAAKVAEGFSGHKASTIHKLLYRGDTMNPGNTQFFLSQNNYRDTLFIVDEASLISDVPDAYGRSLLTNLVRYVYSAPGCKMVLVGDEAQLPPVGQTLSTAMSPQRLQQLGLVPRYHSLDIPVRQEVYSGIIYNANFIRNKLFHPTDEMPDAVFAKDFSDVEVVNSGELIDKLATSWAEVGEEETLIITRSNKRANDFNRSIRNMVMYAEEPLERGDKVVIAKNDYYWGKINEQPGLIANGETAEVVWVGRTEKAYGRYFTDVELRFPGESRVMSAKVMLRSLVADGPAIPREEMQKFYQRVMSAYEGEYTEKVKGVAEDPYYNALQMKYAYCVTCHKAQGGQWKHVYIDMSGIAPEAIGPDFYRWLYTAVTRASVKVFFINPGLEIM
ncbi:MAG: AAA family ATPase [Bacteroidales bacterium]|nr:AAA family ATPase [Bacteroidales bacterium]